LEAKFTSHVKYLKGQLQDLKTVRYRE